MRHDVRCVLDGACAHQPWATRLAKHFKDFEEGKEVFGVRLPQKGAGRDAARRLFGARLAEAGYQGVSFSNAHKMRQKLEASDWDAAVLLTEEDLTAPLDPLLREDPALVARAREYMTSVKMMVSPTPATLLRDLDPWLQEKHSTTREEAGYRRAACRRIFTELARPYRVGSDVGTTDSKQARPKGLQGRFRASLPYESLQIDAWTVDCLALDQYGKTVRLFLLAAVDTVTKKSRALRFVAHEPTMQDIKLLIFDTVKGVPIWPVGVPACPRLPDFIELGEELVDLLSKEDPEFQPTGMIHLDNGSAMIGSDALEAARSVGIHVQPARPGKGPDKPGIESWFDTLVDFVPQLPGATGSKSTKRPRTIARLLSVQHLELFLRLWVEVVYHERPHSGLRDPRLPGVQMSPNDYEAHLLRAHGTVPVSAHPFAAVGLLPMVFEDRLPAYRAAQSRRPEGAPAKPIPTRRVVHDEGVRNRLRDYDSEATERLKEYTQGAPGVGIKSRPVSVFEHPYDPDAIIVRNVDGDLLVLPHRDLTAPEAPLADEAQRDLRDLLLMATPAPTHAALKQRTALIVAAARDLSEPMPKRAARGAAAVTTSTVSEKDWAIALGEARA